MSQRSRIENNLRNGLWSTVPLEAIQRALEALDQHPTDEWEEFLQFLEIHLRKTICAQYRACVASRLQISMDG
jgi:hypothetical protein